MKNTKFILKLAAILFAIVFICSFLLVLCNNLTKDRIAALQEQAESNAKTEVLPEAKEFVEAESNDSYIAYKGLGDDGSTVGFCFKVGPSGFGGQITMMVGINLNGEITGVDITQMSETPGLGAKADDKEWIDRFKGKNGEVSVVKGGNASGNEINAISGATITSKAVASGVNTAVAAAEELISKEGK